MKKYDEDILDLLIAYSDGELTGADIDRVKRLMAEDADLREMEVALRCSLQAANMTWKTQEEKFSQIKIPRRGLRKNRIWCWVATVAACVAMALGLGIWRQQIGKPILQEQPHLSVEDVIAKVERSGFAAQLLAAVNHLAQQPGGKVYAQQHYVYLAEHYGDVDAGLIAKKQSETF